MKVVRFALGAGGVDQIQQLPQLLLMDARLSGNRPLQPLV